MSQRRAMRYSMRRTEPCLSSDSECQDYGEDLYDQYGTPKTRIQRYRKPEKQPWKSQPRKLGRRKLNGSSSSLEGKGSMNGSQQEPSLKKKSTKDQRKRESEQSKKLKQGARLWKELTTTFQVLGIGMDSAEPPGDQAMISHRPTTGMMSWKNSFLLRSETNSAASAFSCTTSQSYAATRVLGESWRGTGTSTDEFEQGDGCLSHGAYQLLEEISLDLDGAFSDKLRHALKDVDYALEELNNLKDSMDYISNDHSVWARKIGKSILTAQKLTEELQFSFLAPNSGSLEGSPSSTNEGELLNRVLGSKIQSFHNGLHTEIIQNLKKISPLFSADNAVQLKDVFDSACILIRNSQQLLESESRLSEEGIGNFYFEVSDQFMESLRDALSELLYSATRATNQVQLQLLARKHLSNAACSDGKTVQELTGASKILLTTWCGCFEMVIGLAQLCRRCCAFVPWDSVHKLKCAALHEFATTLMMAAAEAEGMQNTFHAPKNVTLDRNVWRTSTSTAAGPTLNDEVAQAHLWLMPCILDLFKYAHTITRQLKCNIAAELDGDTTCSTLSAIRSTFFNLIMASIGRMCWLLSKPESVTRNTLEQLKFQGSQTLLLVKKYDKGHLAFSDDYLSSNEGMKKYRDLGASTDQLTNSILHVRTKLKLRKNPDDVSTSENLRLLPRKSDQESNTSLNEENLSAAHIAKPDRLSQTRRGAAKQLPCRRGSALTQQLKNRKIYDSGPEVGIGLQHSGNNGDIFTVRGKFPEEHGRMDLGKRMLLEPEDQYVRGPCQAEIQKRDYGAPGGVIGIEHSGSLEEKTEKLGCPEESVLLDKTRKSLCAADISSRPFILTSPFGAVPEQLKLQQEHNVVLKDSNKRLVFDSSLTLGTGPDQGCKSKGINSLNDGLESEHLLDALCQTSTTAELNNSAGSKPAWTLSYAEVVRGRMKSRSGCPTTDVNPISSAMPYQEDTSSAANAVVLENLMETKLSSTLDRMPSKLNEDSDFSSVQLCSSNTHSKDGWVEDRFGLHIEDMSDTSIIDPKYIKFRTKMGTGASGQVFEAEYQGGACAVKLLNLPKDALARQEFEREILLHCRLTHPNIVRYFGHVKNFGSAGDYSGPGLVMELCPLGSLLSLVGHARDISHLSRINKLEAGHKKLAGYFLWTNWKKRLKLGADIACGMRFLHSNNIIHRDLTSYNTVVNLSWEAKVCDFARSRYTRGRRRMIDRSNTIANSPAWSAPEIINGKPYSTQADVFSLGVILWELASLERPYEEQLSEEMHFQMAVINSVKAGQTLPLPESVSPPLPEWSELKALITECWNWEPDKRPTMEEVHQRLVSLHDGVGQRKSSEMPNKSS